MSVGQEDPEEQIAPSGEQQDDRENQRYDPAARHPCALSAKVVRRSSIALPLPALQRRWLAAKSDPKQQSHHAQDSNRDQQYEGGVVIIPVGRKADSGM